MTPARPRATPAARLAALGPYFAVEVHGPHTPVRVPWQPLDALLGSAAALRDRSEDVRAALADLGGRDPESVEFRVAASVAQLGLAARLLAPVFGTALITRAAPPVDVSQLRWVPAVTSLFRLSLPEAALAAPPSPDAGTLARDLTRSLLHDLLGALVEAFAALAVSRRVLWGNVASAINGSAAMITASRPDLGQDTVALASALLGAGPLAGAYRGLPGSGFQRQSCCLIYRIASNAPPQLCGDCILSRRSLPRPHRPIRSVQRQLPG